MEATGLGVIDSLSAGYRFLGRRLELLLIPVALDILLWLGPCFQRGAAFRAIGRGAMPVGGVMEGVPPDMAAMTAQVADMLTEVGRHSNLMGDGERVQGCMCRACLWRIWPGRRGPRIRDRQPAGGCSHSRRTRLDRVVAGGCVHEFVAAAVILGGAAKPAMAADFAYGIAPLANGAAVHPDGGRAGGRGRSASRFGNGAARRFSVRRWACS